MKNTFTFLLVLAMALTAHAQTFVHAGAMGNNDGSSWQHAYTSLSAALADSEAEEIWVAAGTYTADSATDADYAFFIQRSVALYGGFAGTESTLGERNLQANVTILSADVNADDVAGNFETNRGDNLWHVVYIDSLIAGGVTLDGFTIAGGHTTDNGNLPLFNRTGGGIFSYSTIFVNNCTFLHNFARAGASIYLDGLSAPGSTIRNSTFTENRASSQSAGIYMFDVQGCTISNCDFIKNTTDRGVIYPNLCRAITIDSCYFRENVNAAGFGAALFNWNSRNLVVKNSTFTKNNAASGGVIYNDGREHDDLTLTIDNCLFEENAATGWGGGAIYNWEARYVLKNSTLKANTAVNTAGAIYSAGAGSIYTVENSVFERNQAFGGWGGGIANYTDATATIRDCDFIGNEVVTSGGAVTSGFKSKTTILNCYFQENVARYGGAIYGQNDTTAITIDSCTFFGNRSNDNGGAFYSNGGVTVDIDHSVFEGNISDFGGAMGYSGNDLEVATLNIWNSHFRLNAGENQAGAINLKNANATIANCLINYNLANGNGIGGAISNNVLDSLTTTVTILNSTIVDNIGTLGAGIAQWEENEMAEATIILQNTMLRNTGDNYAIEQGTPQVLSQGGNLSADASLSAYLTHEKDLNNVDPLFVSEDDYHLQAGSPAIDAGVSEGAPETDIDGNPRVGAVDIGSYEYQEITGIDDLSKEALQLVAYPNPVTEQLWVNLKNDWKGDVSISVTNLEGKILLQEKVSKSNQEFLHRLNVKQLPEGVYQLTARKGTQQRTISVVKQ